MSQNILIIGANSGIAEAVARKYAAEGASFFLVARNEAKLNILVADLTARGAKKANSFALDLNNYDEIPTMLDAAWISLSAIDIALVAHGTLPDQQRTETDLTYAVLEFRTNAETFIASLSAIGERFKQQGSGVIAAIGSVAGDRGRGSNYLYGAAKAAIDTYTSGLRASLYKHGVHVMLIKPGFVATAMTAELNLPQALTVQPEKVANDIFSAIGKRKDVLYTPWFWSLIMLIIRWIPLTVFKRMKL